MNLQTFWTCINLNIARGREHIMVAAVEYCCHYASERQTSHGSPVTIGLDDPMSEEIGPNPFKGLSCSADGSTLSRCRQGKTNLHSAFRTSDNLVKLKHIQVEMEMVDEIKRMPALRSASTYDV
jgi:hypothetical protein